jgi:ubiquinone/menaquinone biosynthesis C-methylase UbiE
MNIKSKIEIIKTYQQKGLAGVFDKERNKYLFQKYKHKIESDFLKQAINSVQKDKLKVLDVACGTGRMLPEVFSVEKYIDYVGFDSSKEMTGHLLEKAKRLDVDKNVKKKIGDASKMPFRNGEFDVVYSFHLLWHLPKEDQEKIIKEMLRVCRKDGFVIFDILNKEFIYEKVKGIFGKEKTKEIYKLPLEEVKEIIGRKKFEIEKLNDFPIKNDFVYSFFNIFNHLRKVLPKNTFHMLYLSVKK